MLELKDRIINDSVAFSVKYAQAFKFKVGDSFVNNISSNYSGREIVDI